MTVVTFRDPLFSSPFRLLDDVFRGFGGWSGSRVTGFTPLLDVRENDEEYLVMVDLPGVKSEDVSIEVNDGVVSISGSRTPVETGDAQLKRREGAIGRSPREAERPFGWAVSPRVAVSSSPRASRSLIPIASTERARFERTVTPNCLSVERPRKLRKPPVRRLCRRP